ncbi:MAG: thioredoxin fold domain-containing protein [Deltaproteobacteria bacterium]|nr:thioredoxin fold domain-containing protein [Deltaproteobacteria bacterium]
MKTQAGSFIVAGLLIFLFGLSHAPVFFGLTSSAAHAAEASEIPAKGMVTMVDLGADKCIPCKMMAPIIEKVEKAYQGKAVIHFFDVWKDREPATRFGIRGIPTQIFFDKDAREVYRHVGFMSEEDIVSQLTKMGVK